MTAKLWLTGKMLQPIVYVVCARVCSLSSSTWNAWHRH